VLRPAEPAPAPATPKRSRAGAAIAAAAVIALCGLGAAAYLLRDDLGLGGGTTVATTEAPPTAPPTLPKLPPVGPSASEAPAPPAPTTSATVASTSVPAPPQPSASNPPGPVTAENILDDMPPKAATSETTLGPATVGVSYHAGLPAFADPGGKGLTLHATPPPPAGLAFKDLGGGRSEIAGTPTAAGQAAFEVVAVNHAAKSARMKVALAVNPKPQAPSPPEPPSPAQSVVELEPATVGAAYSAGLPPFRSQAPLALRAGPGLPDGLTLNDLGHGLSQLAGAPKAAGSYAFEVIARNESGAEARMKVRLAVAPPAPPTTAEATVSQTPTATPEPTATVAKVETPPMAASAFLRDYPPPPCFAARARDDDPSGKTITAIGADPAVFETFDAAFRKAVKAEPDLHGLVVRPKQCPAVDFLASAAPAAKPAPRIVLDNPLVGKNRPLSGTILGLGGRPLLLIVVDDDGAVFRLRPQSAGGGDSATFTANFSGDPSSFGKPQLVIAVASDRPLASDQSINGAPSAEFMPKLAAEGREAGAGAGVALFKFVQ
jgi:hypothetical protein